MATYPGGVFAPTTKNTGDSIQASHVNDVQAEVSAIESALLNGITHAVILSSGLTVSTGATILGGGLSVAGGSTLSSGLTVSTGATILGGALSVAAGSTFGGPVVFSSGVTFGANGSITLPRTPFVKLAHSVLVQIPLNTFTGLSWDTETNDDAGLHSTAVNSSRVNLTSSGVWALVAQAEWTGNGTASQFLRICLNDGDALGGVNNAIQNIDPHVQQVYATYLATSTTNYVTVQVQSKDSTGRVNASSTLTGGTVFSAYRVSN